MNGYYALALAFIALAPLPAATQAAERAKAEVECEPAGEEFVYDCTIMLTGKKSGKPMTGARIVVEADMPSMAMAHNVPPAEAREGDRPGTYRARLHLKMRGEWALRLKISGPTRDLIVHRLQFGKGMPMGDMKDGEGDRKGGMKVAPAGE